MRWTSEHSIWFWTPTLRMISTREVNFQEVSFYNAHLRMYFCVSSHIIIFSVCNKLINRRNLSSVSFDPAGEVWNARVDSRISSLGTSISCKWSSKSPSSISIEWIQSKANCRHILSYCWKANCVNSPQETTPTRVFPEWRGPPESPWQESLPPVPAQSIPALICDPYALVQVAVDTSGTVTCNTDKFSH
jgi:hypothetical protein